MRTLAINRFWENAMLFKDLTAEYILCSAITIAQIITGNVFRRTKTKMDRLKYPEYSRLQTRSKTFASWSRKEQAKKMAEAGFFSTSKNATGQAHTLIIRQHFNMQ